ncbi:cryptochrome/photolyase family protein [Nocardiopsis valliformis]|uniref:cryptochrome/photolyase family protein n=1 Tax=Nocardiopsis valliformis TaxID=239974 RepID=UPI0003480C0C|nr:cryptochrome/photolyase family protein [Nocardiopsis valliformis]
MACEHGRFRSGGSAVSPARTGQTLLRAFPRVMGAVTVGYALLVLPSPGFALGRSDFARWAGERSGFRMEDFYRDQRRRFQILMEPDGELTGGRWNFDKDNREGPPRGAVTLDVPPPWHPRENDIDDQVR